MDNKNNSNSLPGTQAEPKQDKEVETSPKPPLVQPIEKEVKIIKEETPPPINLPTEEETPIPVEKASQKTSPATGDNFLNDEMLNSPKDKSQEEQSNNTNPSVETDQSPDQELPHQPNNLNPEDIVEPEQAPLEEIITAAEKAKAAVQDAAGVAPRDRLKPAQRQPDKYPGERPSPKLEEKFKEHHKEKKKILLEIKKTPAPEKKNFFNQYLQKLTEFRAQANKKRSDQVKANLETILNFARQKQKITNNDVEKLIGVKDRHAANYLNKLEKQKKIIRFGKTANIFYKPVKY